MTNFDLKEASEFAERILLLSVGLYQSGEPQEICHQIDFDECYMHYVSKIGTFF